MAQRPIVFISSTADDLKEHRQEAKEAVLASGFAPEMMEYFPASGRPTLQACLEKVDEAEVLVLLVAHRYGWVPVDPLNSDQKSITWLEYERALLMRKEVLAFLVDPKYDWPTHLLENYRLVDERQKAGDEYYRLHEEVIRNEKKLEEFKKELGRYLTAEFTDAASVRSRVSEALNAWRLRHFPAVRSEADEDPGTYLHSLEEETHQIRIKGLRVKRAEPYWFGIDEVYIPLTTVTNQKIARVTSHCVGSA
jgi:hypothetical protein